MSHHLVLKLEREVQPKEVWFDLDGKTAQDLAEELHQAQGYFSGLEYSYILAEERSEG